jgi:hypothetical protein
MKKIVNGVLMDMTPEEVEVHLAAAPPTRDTPPVLTKEQLMAELAALTAKIQALE